MARYKGPIYKEEGVVCNPDLLKQLHEAVAILEDKMRAKAPIIDGRISCGFGVNKAQRGISADNVISIAKAIKALKGW
jgi:hypothetical protein